MESVRNYLLRAVNKLQARLAQANERYDAPKLPTSQDSNNKRPVNLAAHAVAQILESRHEAREQFEFRAISQNGAFVEKTEKWFHEDNSRKTVLRQARVITVSGQIVSVDRVQGVCWCGGYDDLISRCYSCGRPLCRLHRRVFRADGVAVILCDKHYRDAVDSYNTWSSINPMGKNS